MTRSRVATLLEKITRIIPGIAGYQDREKRRDGDKAIREKAASEVARCRHLLMGAMNDLSRSGGTRNLRVIGGLERMETRLERLEDEIRFASYGYAGWFHREGIALDDLERLYEYDLGLLDAAATLPEYVGDPVAVGKEQDWTDGLDQAIEDLRRVFEDRKRLLAGGEATGE